MKHLIIAAALIAMSPAMGAFYEWKDPETGKYKAGNKPPEGVEHWLDGQRPGAGGAKPPESKPQVNQEPVKPTETRRATADEVTECLKFIKTNYGYKDPESVKIEGDAYTLVYFAGDKHVLVNANGKNSFGAYAGAKLVTCFYNHSGILHKAE